MALNTEREHVQPLLCGNCLCNLDIFNVFIVEIILHLLIKVKRNFNNLTTRRVMAYLGVFNESEQLLYGII